MNCDCLQAIEDLRRDTTRLKDSLRRNEEDTIAADRILSHDLKQVMVRLNTHNHQTQKGGV